MPGFFDTIAGYTAGCCVRPNYGEEVVVALDGLAELRAPTSLAAPTNSHTDWKERQLLVRKIGDLDQYWVAEEVPKLAVALRDEHWQVRREAAHSLQKLGSEAVRQALTELRAASNDSDNLVSAAANRALQVCSESIDGIETTAVKPSKDGVDRTLAKTEFQVHRQLLLGGSSPARSSPSRSTPRKIGAIPELDAVKEDNILSDQLSEGALSVSTDDGSSIQGFTVILGSETGHRGRLGIDIDFGRPEYLTIKKVETGLVSQWNAANPQKQIEVGDHFVEINGESGSSRRLMELITLANKLTISVRRPEARSYLHLLI